MVGTSVGSLNGAVLADTDRLALPFAVVTTSAIPGLLPVQHLDGHPHWDGGVAANVPLLTGLRMGAASLVVLDPGDICHREVPPGGVAATTLAALGTAIRQRVLVEVAGVADQVPVLYLERPCVTGRQPLSFASTPDLLERGAATARAFLAEAPLPAPGRLVGAPHAHHGEGSDRGGHEPRFPRGLPGRT